MTSTRRDPLSRFDTAMISLATRTVRSYRSEQPTGDLAAVVRNSERVLWASFITVTYWSNQYVMAGSGVAAFLSSYAMVHDNPRTPNEDEATALKWTGTPLAFKLYRATFVALAATAYYLSTEAKTPEFGIATVSCGTGLLCRAARMYLGLAGEQQ